MPQQYSQATSITNFVGKADSAPIVSAMETLLSKFGMRQAWLGKGHPYSGRVTKLLNEGKAKSPTHRVRVGAMAQYIAASAVLHCFDGWNFLGRAFEGVARGDRRTSIHFAYYAELRAGMSLLASRGIGVFDQRHISIESVNHARWWNTGTHPLVPAALQEWADKSTGAGDIFSSIFVEGLSIEAWLQRVGAGPVIDSRLTRDWLKNWSIDLKRFAGDRNERNEASYRPDSVRYPSPPEFRPLPYAIEPILAVWKALEPSSMGGADILDRHLLRRALRYAYTRQTGLEATGPQFSRFIDQATPASQSLFDFVKGAVAPDDLQLFSVAEDRRADLQPLPILSRAVLLLRMASASTFGLLSAAGAGFADFRFWWENRLSTFGLWDGPPPGDLRDLWADVQDAIASVETWRAGPGAGDPPPCDAVPTLGAQVAFTQFQRPALWLLR